VVFIFYNFGSVWENRKVIVNGSGYEQCSPYQFRLTPGLKTLTEAHPSVTQEQGKQAHADGSPVWLDADADSRGLPPSSLSPPTMKAARQPKLLPFSPFSLSRCKPLPSAHRWLAVASFC
jgi:hypothetical protein